MLAAMATAAPLPRHFRELDVLRGAAIVGVVYLHAYFGPPWPEASERGLFAMHLAHLFAQTAVPIFLFISAFLQSRDRSDGFGAFQLNKAGRIYLPALFWMLAAFAFRVHEAGGVSRDLVRALLEFNIAGQFYYIFVLVLFYALAYPLRRWPARRLAWLAAIAFVVNLAGIAWYSGHAIQGNLAVYAYRDPLNWVFFYAFGLWAGVRFGSLEWTRRALPWALAGLFAVGAVHMVRGAVFDSYPTSYFGVTQFLFSSLALVALPGLVLALFRSRPTEMATRPLVWLAPYAYAIYLVHVPFFMEWVNHHTVSESRFADNYFQLMNGLFLVGFFSTLAFVVAVSLVLPGAGSQLLGIPPRRRWPRTSPSAEKPGRDSPTPETQPHALARRASGSPGSGTAFAKSSRAAVSNAGSATRS
jgi:peptidoglycan/LPS O-acetylase OafA/YrhL